MTTPASWRTAPLHVVIARWDTLVASWDLTGGECSALLGSGGVGPVDEVASYGLATAERRMRLLVALGEIVASVYDGDEERIHAWLRGANGNLRGRSPLGVMTRSPEWIHWLVTTMEAAA